MLALALVLFSAGIWNQYLELSAYMRQFLIGCSLYYNLYGASLPQLSKLLSVERIGHSVGQGYIKLISNN
jgi:hypothetical protein